MKWQTCGVWTEYKNYFIVIEQSDIHSNWTAFIQNNCFAIIATLELETLAEAKKKAIKYIDTGEF